MDNNVPVIETDIYGLTLAIQDGFEKMIQGDEWVRIKDIRFYLTRSAIDQGETNLSLDYYLAELRKMILPSTTMYLLKYNWYADRYWQGGVEDFEIFEIGNPCDYEEILSVTKKYFKKLRTEQFLDLENVYIDASSIDDYWQRATAQQDEPQEPVFVSCEDCKYGHTKCANPDGLFYSTPCRIVKWCEQGEAC